MIRIFLRFIIGFVRYLLNNISVYCFCDIDRFIKFRSFKYYYALYALKFGNIYFYLQFFVR